MDSTQRVPPARDPDDPQGAYLFVDYRQAGRFTPAELRRRLQAVERVAKAFLRLSPADRVRELARTNAELQRIWWAPGTAPTGGRWRLEERAS